MRELGRQTQEPGRQTQEPGRQTQEPGRQMQAQEHRTQAQEHRTQVLVHRRVLGRQRCSLPGCRRVWQPHRSHQERLKRGQHAITESSAGTSVIIAHTYRLPAPCFLLHNLGEDGEQTSRMSLDLSKISKPFGRTHLLHAILRKTFGCKACSASHRWTRIARSGLRQHPASRVIRIPDYRREQGTKAYRSF